MNVFQISFSITRSTWHTETPSIRFMSPVISTAVYGLTAPILPPVTDVRCRWFANKLAWSKQTIHLMYLNLIISACCMLIHDATCVTGLCYTQRDCSAPEAVEMKCTAIWNINVTPNKTEFTASVKRHLSGVINKRTPAENKRRASVNAINAICNKIITLEILWTNHKPHIKIIKPYLRIFISNNS